MEATRGMNYVFHAQKELLIVEKELLVLSSKKDDEGTNAFMSDLIREKEKTNWMFSAWLTSQTENVF
jgi:starvation-inducible DNA-binding protein